MRLLVPLALLGCAHAAPEEEPRLGVYLPFDGEPLGELSAGWNRVGEAPYVAQVAEDAGRTVLFVENPDAPTSGRQAQVEYRFRCEPYRGTRLRLRVVARFEPVRPDGDEWLDVWFSVWNDQDWVVNEHRPGDDDTRPGWIEYVLEGDVPADATWISFGAGVTRGSRVWIDTAHLSALGPVEPYEAPRPLGADGTANLVALARLLGAVRYFHPSDGAKDVDWAGVARLGVDRVEDAGSPDELAVALAELLLPVAPTLRVAAPGIEPAPPDELRLPAKEAARFVWVTSWRHRGLGPPEGMVYASQQARRRVRGGVIPEGWRDPADVLELDLGRGVTAHVPVALYRSRDGTLPHRSTDGIDAEIAALAPPTGNDRTTRLANVILAWNVFQHFYPYFDEVDVDWERELAPALERAAVDVDSLAHLRTLEGLVAALDDGHGYVQLAGHEPRWVVPFDWAWIEGSAIVTASAEGADPRVGDAVLAVDGRPIGTAVRDWETRISSSTARHRRQQALGRALFSAHPRAHAFELERPGGERYELSVALVEPSDAVRERRERSIAELEDGIVYVDLDLVTDPEFAEWLDRLVEAKGLVFDLRGYPKMSMAFLEHLVAEEVGSPLWRIPGPALPDRAEVEWHESQWFVRPREPRFTGPVVYLTDERAISAAETIMTIVESHGLARIVGAPTAGTNGNVNPYWLPGDYQVMWTGMNVRRPDGSAYHGRPVQPTDPVERTRADVIDGRDAVLERAIELLRD